MNINATLIGQSIVFVIFVWFCMNYIWPPIMQALNERKAKIAEGLAAAERGQHEQELAEKHATDVLKKAKEEANEIVANAHKRATEIVEDSKGGARVEGERLLAAARAEIEQEANRVREELRKNMAGLVMAGTAQILQSEVDITRHNDLLEKLSAEL